jgi:hypothetical protein
VPSRAELLRSPQWGTLIGFLDGVCYDKGLLTKSGRPNYRALARACGLHPGLLPAWRRRLQRPSRASVETIARWAGQPVGPWLRAGGFDEAG